MAGIKILSPMVEEYIIVVSIPFETPIIHITRVNSKKQTVDEAEHYFITRRDNAGEYSQKVEFDRARALMKWASCSDARLVEMITKDKKLKASFSFSSYENMMYFRDNLHNVGDATMK